MAVPTEASADREAPTRTDVTEGITERVHAVDYLDERARRHAKPAAKAPRAEGLDPGRYLEVQGSGESLLVPLADEVMRIGRGLGADLRLDENSVSRRHAIVVQDAEGVRILDDRSSNGTFVNGRRVEQAQLRSGDEVTLGRVALRYLEA
jgi:pSer/pThr/pTyr-binding forkhead associated (FHA) protein